MQSISLTKSSDILTTAHVDKYRCYQICIERICYVTQHEFGAKQSKLYPSWRKHVRDYEYNNKTDTSVFGLHYITVTWYLMQTNINNNGEWILYIYHTLTKRVINGSIIQTWEQLFMFLYNIVDNASRQHAYLPSFLRSNLRTILSSS